MRTTRAYAAGFGTAGSLLAGAAVLFVVASAIVAFQGWPRVANQTSPAAVQVNAAPAPPSRVSRRLRAVVVPRRAATVPVAAAAGGHRTFAATQRAGTAPSAPAGGSSSSTAKRRSGATIQAGHARRSISAPTVTLPAGSVATPVRSVARQVTEVGVTAGNAISKRGPVIGG